MSRSLNAPLSPHEEITLGRVARGATIGDLPAGDVARLRSLALVEGRAGRVRLTASGQRRYESMCRAPGETSSKITTAFHKARLQ